MYYHQHSLQITLFIIKNKFHTNIINKKRPQDREKKGTKKRDFFLMNCMRYFSLFFASIGQVTLK